MNAVIEFIGSDQNWQDGTTTYWFRIDGQTFGVVEGERNPGVIDADGMPVDYNDTLRNQVQSACVVTDEMRRKAAGF
jgi:hypothetical protein